MPSHHRAPSLPSGDLLTLDEVERRHIMYVLEACHQQRALAAQVLGIDRKTLYRRLLAYGAYANDGDGVRHRAAAARHPAAM